MLQYIRLDVVSRPCYGPPQGPFDYGQAAVDAAGGDIQATGIELSFTPVSTATGQPVGPPVQGCSMAEDDPLPPPPPTATELWQAANLPQPQIEVSPPDGLVGFEAWFWSNVPDETVSVSVTLRGWTAQVTAEPHAYLWDPGDGSGQLESSAPGTAEDPAARHPYIRQGTYTVTHTVVWRGSFTLSGYGVSMSDDLGTVRPSGTGTYDVEEREAVILQ